MPDTPPESGAEEAGAAGTTPPDDDAPKALDVPEWVSELRRLYVEPKTRAKLRQEGAIAPQKRKLGLPGLRGSRRSGDGNGGDRAGGAHSTPPPSDRTDAGDQAPPAPAEQPPPAPAPSATRAAAPAEPIFTSTAAVQPSPVPPAQPDTERGDSASPRPDGSHRQPQPIVEEQVGAWLNSYLEATGHAADDPGDSTAGASAGDRPSTEAAVEGSAAQSATGLTPPTATSAATGSQGGVDAEVSPSSSATDAGSAPDPEPLEEEHHRSLAELAGLSAPEPGPETWMPAVPPPPEPVTYEPPVDTVVTSIPEPRREPELPAEPEPAAQPETNVERAVAQPAVVEPVAARSNEPELEPELEPEPEPEPEAEAEAESDHEPIVEPPAAQPPVTEPAAIEPVAVESTGPELEPEQESHLEPIVEPATAHPAVVEPVAATYNEPEPEPEPAETAALEAPEAHPVRSTAAGPAAAAAVDGTTSSAGTEEVDPASGDRALDGGSEPHRPLPGRPSTVPAVTLSWREAESFDIGLPDVDIDDEERSIVVEPPSQLVAARRRRREHDHDDRDAPPLPSDAEPVPEPQPEADPVPSDDTGGAASSGGGGRGRWVLVAVICLLIAAAAVWYFLLRDDGSGSGARSGTATVISASTLAPGADPVTRLV